MTADVAASISLFIFAALIAAAYLMRLFLHGAIRFDRIEKMGGSALLGKGLLEMGYWSLQPAARLLVRLGVSANALSWTALALGAGAGCMLSQGYFGFACLVAMAAGLFDALDGMVARATGSVSEAGKMLDSALDRYVEFFFLLGLLVFYRDVLWMQVVVAAAVMGSFMVSYSTALAEILRKPIPRGAMRRPERMVYLTLGAALAPFWPHPHYTMIAALVVVAVVSNVSAARRLAFLHKSLSDPVAAPVQLGDPVRIRRAAGN